MTGKASKGVDDVSRALAWLKQHASKKTRDEMGPRYGVHTDKAYGVSMANLKTLARELGRSHDLALALWDTGWYEARMVACMVDEPARVTSAQMERWCKDFDNWGICDTVCFKLFDQVPHAYAKIPVWCARKAEFQRRAGFALLACVALHDKAASDAPFLEGLELVERGANDERNFVWKSVSWAIRAIGGRNPALRKAASAVATRLAASSHDTERRIGKEALKALTRP